MIQIPGNPTQVLGAYSEQERNKSYGGSWTKVLTVSGFLNKQETSSLVLTNFPLSLSSKPENHHQGWGLGGCTSNKGGRGRRWGLNKVLEVPARQRQVPLCAVFPLILHCAQARGSNYVSEWALCQSLLNPCPTTPAKNKACRWTPDSLLHLSALGTSEEIAASNHSPPPSPIGTPPLCRLHSRRMMAAAAILGPSLSRGKEGNKIWPVYQRELNGFNDKEQEVCALALVSTMGKSLGEERWWLVCCPHSHLLSGGMWWERRSKPSAGALVVSDVSYWAGDALFRH